MSWLSELFGGGDPPPPPISASNYGPAQWNAVRAMGGPEYENIKYLDPVYIAQKNAEDQAKAVAGVTATAPASPVSTPTGPEVALAQLNNALGSGFENTYLPDTLDDPFINTALTSGRGKADEYISNMLKRGVLTESGRAGAIGVLDKQTPGITSRLNELSSALLGSDRANLTNLANQKRSIAQQTPVGTEFDPTPLVNEIASAGQGYAGSFGTRFNASLPPGDLYDTSGVGVASGAVTGPQNISYDPYAVEGGQLSTGLDDQAPPVPAEKKRRTTVF